MHDAVHIPTATRLFSECLATPIGTLVLITDEADCVRALDWEDCAPRLHRVLQRHDRAHRGPGGRARSLVAVAVDPGRAAFVVAVRNDDGRADGARARDTATLSASEPRDGSLVCPRPTPSAARAALLRYFDGDLAAIDGVAVDPHGTPFHRSVWAALRAIPVGRTASYGELAATMGRPRAARAVGHANGANPIAIIVPCHRVIGASGGLTGYAGGLARKRWLLAHEAANESRIGSPTPTGATREPAVRPGRVRPERGVSPLV